MQRKVAELTRVDVAGPVDEGERRQQQRHHDEEGVGNAAVGLQAVTGALPENA